MAKLDTTTSTPLLFAGSDSIQSDLDKSDWIASHMINWLTDGDELCCRIEELSGLREDYGLPGASQAAAKYLMEHIPAKPGRTQIAA